MKFRINDNIKTEFFVYIEKKTIQHLSKKLLLGILVLTFFSYTDIRAEAYKSLLSRIVPLGIASVLLIFHTFKKKEYRSFKKLIYNIYLFSLFIMMLLKCGIAVDEPILYSVVSGTLLVVFIISIELKTVLKKAILVYFVPITLFYITLSIKYDLTKYQELSLANLYPIVFIGFLVNMAQYYLHYNYFETEHELKIKKDKANTLYNDAIIKNNKLDRKKKEIEQQKKKIEEQHSDIVAGIESAERIQKAMFPDTKTFDFKFQDYFILFSPLEKVSGDFYWADQYENKFIYAIADSTGHGVSGALVSMLGISLLNKIINQHKNLQASEILDLLRYEVKKSLKQTDILKDESTEGMDIALCLIEQETLKLQFAGANCSLYIIRDKEFIVFKADRQPISIWINERKFKNYNFQLQKNDILYTFSDGFQDQLNENNEKYSIKRVKDFLLKISSEKSMKKQKTMIENEHIKWKKYRKQTDDIIVTGIKI